MSSVRNKVLLPKRRRVWLIEGKANKAVRPATVPCDRFSVH